MGFRVKRILKKKNNEQSIFRGAGSFNMQITGILFSVSNVCICTVFQDTLQLLISVMLLADLFVTLLMLLQFYWISLGAFLAVLLILPLSLLSSFPAGLNALFSKGPRRASLARIYALWNSTSLSNIVSLNFDSVL